MNKNQSRLDRLFRRIELRFPRLGYWVFRLRQPRARLIRVPLGILLVIGGIFSFLPVLGLWMLPLGLLLLAIDLPFLQGPVNSTVITSERRWTTWRRSRRKPPPTKVQP